MIPGAVWPPKLFFQLPILFPKVGFMWVRGFLPNRTKTLQGWARCPLWTMGELVCTLSVVSIWSIQSRKHDAHFILCATHRILLSSHSKCHCARPLNAAASWAAPVSTCLLWEHPLIAGSSVQASGDIWLQITQQKCLPPGWRPHLAPARTSNLTQISFSCLPD